jgi:hypothetical protein
LIDLTQRGYEYYCQRSGSSMDNCLIKLSLLRHASPGGRAVPYLNVLVDNERIGSIGGFGLLDPRYNKSSYWQKTFEVTPGKHTICVGTIYGLSRSKAVIFDLPPNGCVEFQCGFQVLKGRTGILRFAMICLWLLFFGVIIPLSPNFIPASIVDCLGEISLLLLLILIVDFTIACRKPGAVCFIEQSSLSFNDKLRDFY